MGGMTIWSKLKGLHFVHEWFPWNRVDSYIENEILDLTGPRSRLTVRVKSITRYELTVPKGNVGP